MIGWGGRCFRPRFLSPFFFFVGQEVGSVAMASPPSVCLRCTSVCSPFCPSFSLSLVVFASSLTLSVFAQVVSFRVGCLSLFLRLFVGVVRFPFLCLCVCRGLLPLAVAHVVGGGGIFCVGGHACCGVCVFSSASPCFKESPRGAPLCMRCLLLLLLSRPLASCPYGCFFMLCLSFLMHVHAQRRRPLGLDFTASCVAALLSQDPSPSGPPAFPRFGSCCPHHG